MRKFKKRGIEFSNSIATLNISLEVIEELRKYEQREGYNESGGILLGCVTKNCDYIQKITVPNKYDLKGLTFFIRSKEPAQKKINKYWKASKGLLIYLGEWHTHYENSPNPSNNDINMIKKTLKDTDMEIDFLYLIIVGVNNTYWVGKCTSKGVKSLQKM